MSDMETNTILQTVVEMPEFTRQSQACMDAAVKEEFVDYIAANPLQGKLIVGTGGVRKIRWAGNSNQGKSGGVRVIYYYYDEDTPIFLFTVYDKHKKENLTQNEKNMLKSIITKIINAYQENSHE
jgi:hypothetical protein